MLSVLGPRRCLSRRFWAFPWTYLTKDINFLYRMCMFALATGARIAGVKVRTLGLETNRSRAHPTSSCRITSPNLDPPLTLPLIRAALR